VREEEIDCLAEMKMSKGGLYALVTIETLTNARRLIR